MAHESVEFTWTLPTLLSYMDQLSYAAVLIDHSCNVLEANNVFLQATGYPLMDVKGNNISKVIYLDYKGSTYSAAHSLLCQAFDSKVYLIHKEGNRIPAHVITMSGQNNTGEPLHLLHFPLVYPVQNKALVERFFDCLTQEENIGMIILNEHGFIVEISLMACEILGLDKKSIINRHIEDTFPGLSKDLVLVDHSLLSGIVATNRAVSWTNNNKRFELILDSNSIHNENGSIIGAYVIFKNITPLRSWEHKIERNDRLALIGQIAAGAAHEIRNPLTSIKGLLQIMKGSLQEAKLDKEVGFAELMLGEVQRINALVSEFLLLSKPKDSQYELVDLNEVLDQIIPIVETEAILHGIEVVNKAKGELPLVVGNPELLKQVFLNICKNGIEAMGSEGTLTVDYKRERDGNHCINIHDTGPGIPSYIIDKIFDPFFTTKEEGTGLGLPICQKIIHDHGGQIRVASKGYGTTFHIIIQNP